MQAVYSLSQICLISINVSQDTAMTFCPHVVHLSGICDILEIKTLMGCDFKKESEKA